MALIKCHECSTEVSTEAKTCPKCGAKVKKPAGLTAWLLGGIVIIVVSIISASIPDQEQMAAVAAAEAAKTPEQRAAEKAQKEADTARYAIAAATSKLLRETMRDPDSLKYETLRVSEDSSVVCAEYSARNGFGGMNREFMVVADGKASQKPSAWNKHCTKSMADMLWAAK